VGLFSFVSCYEGSEGGPAASMESSAVKSMTSVTTDIFYGQDNYAGTLTISNDETNIYVTYTITAEGITLNQVHFWAGTDLNLAPVNGSGVPVPGQFPYKAENLNATTYTITIPISSLGIVNVDEYCGATVYTLAHAALSNGETAWSFGTPFSEWTGTTRWGWYGTYVIDCENGDPTPGLTPETAFAKGGWVFASSANANPEGLPSLALTRNRWGWAINIGADGMYQYDIYAAAGLNNTANGVKVGTLEVTMTGGVATVAYTLLPGFLLSEAHVYAGDSRPDTIAPGQYGYIQYFDPMAGSSTASFDVADLDGDGIWIIAHAVVFGNY
jgi:hypothetical protein